MNADPLPLPPERMPDLSALARRAVSAGAAARRCSVIAPFTGQVIGELPCAAPEDVQAALQRARQAQAGWASTPLAGRRRILMRFHDRVLAERERLMDLIQLEGGKARVHAYEEVLDVAINARYYAARARRILGPHWRRGALPIFTRARLYHHPVGVVGVIAPWNYPLTMAVSDAIPALMAGNAVVLKPSEFTPYSALNAARLLDECGLPPDVFQVVVGDGPVVGAALAAGADFIQFTGSTVTGRAVARIAAERLVKSSLELGGKNAAIVLDDADLRCAVPGVARAIIANGGQLCVSVERVFVQAGIYERFVGQLVEYLGRLRLGAAFDFSTDVGSLLSRAQLDKVQAHVSDAVTKGARLLAGGRPRPDLGPFFFEPTLLEGVTPAMQVYADETFGPVASLYRVETDEEAAARANDTCYGLNADVWTGHSARGRRLALRLQAGTVNLNESYAASWGSIDAPMGGMKQSGLGRRHGPEGLLKYTEEQTVAEQSILPLFFLPGFSRPLLAKLLVWYLRVTKHIPPLR